MAWRGVARRGEVEQGRAGVALPRWAAWQGASQGARRGPWFEGATCFLLETRKTQRSEMTPSAVAASARAATAMLSVLLSSSSLARRALRSSTALLAARSSVSAASLALVVDRLLGGEELGVRGELGFEDSCASRAASVARLIVLLVLHLAHVLAERRMRSSTPCRPSLRARRCRLGGPSAGGGRSAGLGERGWGGGGDAMVGRGDGRRRHTLLARVVRAQREPA